MGKAHVKYMLAIIFLAADEDTWNLFKFHTLMQYVESTDYVYILCRLDTAADAIGSPSK